MLTIADSMACIHSVRSWLVDATMLKFFSYRVFTSKAPVSSYTSMPVTWLSRILPLAAASGSSLSS